MMGKTIVEKIFTRHAEDKDCKVGDYVWVEPDLAISHDLNYPKYRRMLQSIGYPDIAKPGKLFVTIDHTTHSEDPSKLEDHRFIRSDTAIQQVKWFLDTGRHGISHNAPLDLGLVEPGMLVLASDTRAPALGCKGAISIAIGISLTTVMAIGKAWLRVPETINVEIKGKRRPGVMSRDIAQWIANRIGSERADYRCIEFHGSVVEELDTDGRHTLCNAVVDLGIKTAICVPSIGNRPEILGDPDAQYAEELVFDISELGLQVSVPPDPENVVAISEVQGTAITSAFIGSCIGGKMEDMRAAAAVLKNRRIHPRARLTIIPATQGIYQQCLEEGLILEFTKAGAEVAAGICGPCYGVYAPLNDADSAICTATRNDHGRMGSEKSRIYIANSAVVAASAVTGCITDPADLEKVSQ